MSMVDVRAQESFNYSTTCFCRDRQQQILLLGYEKTVYLFFALPTWFCNCILLGARLILFKLPYDSSGAEAILCADNAADQYMLCPLREVFNVHGHVYPPPVLDCDRCVPFENACGQSYTEIDVTQLVRDWGTHQIENNGLLLMGPCVSSYLYYASSQYPLLGMRPMLRLTFKDINPLCALQSAPCDVVVTRPVSGGPSPGIS